MDTLQREYFPVIACILTLCLIYVQAVAAAMVEAAAMVVAGTNTATGTAATTGTGGTIDMTGWGHVWLHTSTCMPAALPPLHQDCSKLSCSSSRPQHHMLYCVNAAVPAPGACMSLVVLLRTVGLKLMLLCVLCVDRRDDYDRDRDYDRRDR